MRKDHQRRKVDDSIESSKLKRKLSVRQVENNLFRQRLKYVLFFLVQFINRNHINSFANLFWEDIGCWNLKLGHVDSINISNIKNNILKALYTFSFQKNFKAAYKNIYSRKENMSR